MATVTRTNLCTNPSFEVSSAGWGGGGNPPPAVAISSAWSVDPGGKSLKITWAAGNVFFPGAVYVLATTPGVQYTVSGVVNVPAGQPAAQFIVGGGGVFAGSAMAASSSAFDVASSLAVTFTASAASHNLSLIPAGTPTAGQFCYLDKVLFEQAPNAGTYFDGASSGCQWTGTAGLSTSQQIGGPLTITVTGDVNAEPPRNVIFVTGAPGATAQISRTDPDGAVRPVRTGDPAALVGGQWVGYDVEVPYGKAVTYTVTPSDGSAAVFVTAPALACTQSWLVHLGMPSLSLRINGIRLTERATESGAVEHDVIGRKYPIIISDGMRRSATYQLSIRTRAESENLAVEAILAGAATVLLQIAYPFTPKTQWEYISIKGAQDARVTGRFGDADRRWTFDVRVADRPAGGVAAQRTFADAFAETGSFQDEYTRFTSFAGLATGVPGT